MHRNIEIVVPAEETEGIIERLKHIDGVIGLAVIRGASLKPAGDVIKLQALNRNSDEVLRTIQPLRERAHVNVATSDLASLSDREEQESIDNDIDDSLWEEVETGLRQTVHVTPNFAVLMFLGGVVSCAGLFLEGTSQAVAFVAASIIAPGFEPVAKCPLAVVLKNTQVGLRALRSFLAGYAVLIAGSVLTFVVLRLFAPASKAALVANPGVDALFEPPPEYLIVSAAGALAGIIMVLTYREAVIAGPLIAMALIPSAALLGVTIVLWDATLIWAAFKRFVLDILFVLVFGIITASVKQWRVHRRKPLM